ncbi:MAG: hypothetical protein EXR73_10820 [Myxococcales bacterium]|nr:hypothetical protein [Myxococcales bacterium]
MSWGAAVVVSVLLAGLVAGGASGCATGRGTGEELLAGARAYQDGLRWRRYDEAALRRLPGEREAFLDQRDELDADLRIDDYEIERVLLQAARSAATIQVRFTWHREPEGIVHETVVEQAWTKRDGIWMLVDEERKRGPEMPGVPEPLEEPRRDAGTAPDDAGPVGSPNQPR